jgi:hypothetical protein
MREVSASTGYGSQSALDVHFGLGDATVFDSVRVEWPSGNVDVLTNLPADRYTNLAEGVTTLGVPDAPASLRLDLTLAPQPARGAATLRFRLPAAGVSRVVLLDVGGRVVAVAEGGPREAGWHTVPVPGVAQAKPGLYFVRVETAVSTGVGRMVVLR